MGASPARSSPATGAATCPACTSPAVPPTLGQACRWSLCPAGSPLMRSTRTMRPLPPAVDPEHLLSKAWLQFFVRVLTRRLRRSFHAIRLARPGVPAVMDGQPLVVYANHPSWWDAALVPVLMARLF